MKNTFKFRTGLAALTILGAISLMSLTKENMQAKGEWVAPASADATENPLKGKAETIPLGKKIYATYCVVCHGDKGKGDGIAASGLTPRPADHSADKFQKQTDGAIFWKLTNGRAPMASYAKTLTEEQRWQVINYMRTLKAKK
jgi:mono/diheme cytochrome c family protein